MASPRGTSPGERPRALPASRAWRIAARTVHIVAMSLVLGGVAWRIPAKDMLAPIAITVLSGIALLGLEVAGSVRFLYQGSGALTFLKIALLGVGELVPSMRLEWYVAATAAASIGSHMPGALRHYSLVHRRVLEPDE